MAPLPLEGTEMPKVAAIPAILFAEFSLLTGSIDRERKCINWSVTKLKMQRYC